MGNKFITASSGVIKKIDKVASVLKTLRSLQKKEVLVGIPEKNSSRENTELTNAELGFILSHGVRPKHAREEIKGSQRLGFTRSEAVGAYLSEHGDPMWQIPPRPFLEPAIGANAETIAELQANVMKSALSGNDNKIDSGLNKLGLYAQSVVKGWFNDPRNGWQENAESTIKRKGSDKPNIDTAQLLNSISYVIKDGNSHD